MKWTRRSVVAAAALTVAGAGLVWVIALRVGEGPSGSGRRGADRVAPVEVAPIETGPIALRRTFSGTLEARAEFVVAPKVSGRIVGLHVDLADMVERGRVVAELDSDELALAVASAEADLAVAVANRTEAQSAFEIAGREFARVKTLRARGVDSESQLDASRAEQLAARARLEVAEAQVTRARVSLETAKIRLGYTRVTAEWSGGRDARVVAERFVDEGETVSANAPLLSIVELDPMTGVIHVTEKEYGRLEPGQAASLALDAYPGETFEGRIARIAPVFRPATRQARIELTVENPDHRLKPGMFVRATVVLRRVPDAVIVPEGALTTRDDRHGLFVVSADGRSVTWRAVEVGIREGDRLQVTGEGLSGRVVTLGQQLLDDGSSITIPGGG